MQNLAAMKRNNYPLALAEINAMTPFERISRKPAANNLRSASEAVSRGSLGMSDFQRSSENSFGGQPPQFSRL